MWFKSLIEGIGEEVGEWTSPVIKHAAPGSLAQHRGLSQQGRLVGEGELTCTVQET